MFLTAGAKLPRAIAAHATREGRARSSQPLRAGHLRGSDLTCQRRQGRLARASRIVPGRRLPTVCTAASACRRVPTYVLWQREPDSPRGRIQLLDGWLRGRVALDGEVAQRFDNCLGCLACVTACPSGVQYEHVIDLARRELANKVDPDRPRRRGHERTVDGPCACSRTAFGCEWRAPDSSPTATAGSARAWHDRAFGAGSRARCGRWTRWRRRSVSRACWPACRRVARALRSAAGSCCSAVVSSRCSSPR